MDADAAAVIGEEEALLSSVRASLARAHASRASRGDGLRLVGELRELRDEARTTSEDDLPGLLHEMVRQRLRERTDDDLSTRRRPTSVTCARRTSAASATTCSDTRSFFDTASAFGSSTGARLRSPRRSSLSSRRRLRGGDCGSQRHRRRGRAARRRDRERARRARARRRLLGRAWRRRSVGATGPALDAGGSGTAPRGDVLGIGIGARDRAGRASSIALLDREQHVVIAISGGAAAARDRQCGECKTTVALHRFARITARDPARSSVERMRVVVPEEGLARLSRRLLEPLGVRGCRCGRSTTGPSSWRGRRSAASRRSATRRLRSSCGSSATRRSTTPFAIASRTWRPSAPPRSRRCVGGFADLFTDRAFLGERRRSRRRGSPARCDRGDRAPHDEAARLHPTAKQVAAITDRLRRGPSTDARSAKRDCRHDRSRGPPAVHLGPSVPRGAPGRARRAPRRRRGRGRLAVRVRRPRAAARTAAEPHARGRRCAAYRRRVRGMGSRARGPRSARRGDLPPLGVVPVPAADRGALAQGAGRRGAACGGPRRARRRTDRDAPVPERSARAPRARQRAARPPRARAARLGRGDRAARRTPRSAFTPQCRICRGRGS